MSAYELGSDEAVIMQESGVSDNRMRISLVLTNKNIIQVKNDRYDRTKDAQSYPLLNLKLLNGKPNILIGKNSFGETQLELYFQDCEKTYVFQRRSSTKKWASAIEKAYKTAAAEVKKAEKNEGLFASLREKITSNRIRGQCKMKCPRCGADLVGEKNEQVKCSFCDSIVTIK